MGAIVVNARMHDSGNLGPAFWLISVAISLVSLVGMWKTLTKANQYGWSILVPIYGQIVLLRVAGKPWWWIFLFLIPLVNFIIGLIMNIDIARNFGKGTGFGFGLAFLGFIFFPILGFGRAQYLPLLPMPAGGEPRLTNSPR